MPQEDKYDLPELSPEKARSLDSSKLIEEKLTKQLSYEEVQEAGQQSQMMGVKGLFDSRDIELKTEIDERELIAVSRLLFVGERYGIGGMHDFVQNLLKLKVSLGRRGRREYVEGLHAEERRMMGRDLTPIGALLERIGGK